MKYFVITDERTHTPVYFDHPDGRMLSLPMVTTQDVLEENFGERLASIDCGSAKFVFEKAGTLSLMVCSNQGETEWFLRSQLLTIYQLLLLVYGPRLQDTRRTNFLKHREKISSLIDTATHLADTELTGYGEAGYDQAAFANGVVPTSGWKPPPDFKEAVRKQYGKMPEPPNRNKQDADDRGGSKTKLDSVEMVNQLMTGQAKFTVIALWNCQADESDELSFKEGDVIEIMDDSNPEWLVGRLNSRIGNVPGSFVERTDSNQGVLAQLGGWNDQWNQQAYQGGGGTIMSNGAEAQYYGEQGAEAQYYGEQGASTGYWGGGAGTVAGSSSQWGTTMQSGGNHASDWGGTMLQTPGYAYGNNQGY